MPQLEATKPAEIAGMKNDIENLKLSKLTERLNVSSELKETILKNIADKTWRDASNETIQAMMKNRPKVLSEMYRQFYKLAEEMGWSKETAEKYANIIVPFLDISERAGYTYYGHQFRSMKIAGIILDEMGIEGKQKAEIMLGMLVHDIGKAGVSDEVLRGTKLTEEIKTHPTKGKEILSSIFEMMGGVSKEDANKIMDIALSHHENLSGTGYPRGLKGEEIPFGVRVAALADSFEAMTAGRKYQASNTFQQAVEIVTKKFRLQLDSKIVEGFLNALKDEKIKNEVFEIIREGGGNP